MFIAVTDVGGVGPLALRDVAQEIESRVRDLQGLSTVEIRGLQDREVSVEVDRARASLYDITVSDVAERIRQQNQNLPAGTFQDASGEATLRAIGDYTSTDQILDTVVREAADGTRIRVRDIATVERDLETPVFITRYDGEPAAIVSIGKKDKSDVRDVVARVDAFLEEFAPLVPEGIKVNTTLDSSDFVTPRIGVLIENLLMGMFLVAGLLWFTIGFRNAMLTIIAIPFSFLTAIIFFPMLDISINSNTLVGMLLVSGMLVDDAIIVLENIYRKIEEGLELKQAVLEGANEVLWPVAAAVLTTIAAFAPLLLVGGTAGKFISVMPKCVVVCLVGLTLRMPPHPSRTLPAFRIAARCWLWPRCPRGRSFALGTCSTFLYGSTYLDGPRLRRSAPWLSLDSSSHPHASIRLRHAARHVALRNRCRQHAAQVRTLPG